MGVAEDTPQLRSVPRGLRAVHVRGVRDDGLLGRPKDQTEAPGYVPGVQIVLVRNPSWSRDTDDLRDAYPDRIEVRIGGDNDDLYNQVAAGTLDFVVDGAVPPEDPVTRPTLTSRTRSTSTHRTRSGACRSTSPCPLRRRPRPQGGELGVRQTGVPAAGGGETVGGSRATSS